LPALSSGGAHGAAHRYLDLPSGFRCIVRVNKETYLAGEKEKNLRDLVALRFDLLRTSEDPVVRGIVLLLLLRFVWAATINLSPQEAYYWNYSIHPDLSYLDHPPMVAWVIRAGTLLLGKSEMGVRIGGLWLVVVSTWLINALGRLWFSRRAGLWAALLFQVIPVYFIYGVLITPDVPLICFWLLTIYLVSIAVLKDRPCAWYGAGAALGFAMLSKYTALFLVLSALLFLIADRAYRKWLLRKEPYLAFFISLVIFSPVILWNYQHQWASFAFQFGRRVLGEEMVKPVRYARHSLIEFLAIQLGSIFPTFLAVLVLSFAVALYFTIKDQGSRWKFCLFFSFPILVFFAVYSIGSAVNVNWPLPGYLALLIAAHTCYRYLRFKSGERFKIAQRKMLVFSVYGLPVLWALALFHMTLVIPFIPVNKSVTGWRELAKTLEREKATTEKDKTTFIFGMDRKDITSELAFYMQDIEDVFSRNVLGKNALGFEFWDSRVPLPGSNAVAVDEDFMVDAGKDADRSLDSASFPDIALLQQHFMRVDEQVTVVPIVRQGKIVRRFYLVRCYGYLGLKQAAIES
jgi:dolichol-phosphate mannosyltransferase